MQSLQAEVVFPYRAELGEGALWDAQQGKLYWVDIVGQKVMAFDPRNRSNLVFDVGQSVGTVVLDTRDRLLLALRNGFARLDPATGQVTLLGDPESEKPGNRFNDGKCDPQGRFWAGSIVEDEQSDAAALYCLHQDLSIRRVLTGLTISNGLAWSADSRTFFHIDTPTHQLRAFDFDADSGALTRPRVVYRFDPKRGSPDGMTLDDAGRFWVALWGGSKVVCVDPHAQNVVLEVNVPVKNVTSCALGGPELNELYITTARVGNDAAALQQQPEAGSLFRAQVPARGVPAPRFKV